MDYKPYSPEWHRKRYLKEALDRYLDDYVDNTTIKMTSWTSSLKGQSQHTEFNKVTELESMLESK